MKSERSLTKYRGLICLNCEHTLDISDKYCANCGQLNSIKKLSFKDFFLEFFGGIFSYDSRMRRTLGTLIFRPGKITRDYISGMRTLYVNPFRFFLSISIIFFIIWSFTFESSDFNSNTSESLVKNELSDSDKEKIKNKLKNFPLGNKVNIDSLLESKKVKEVKNYQYKYISQGRLDSLNIVSSTFKQLQLYSQFYDQKTIADPEEALDSLNHNQASKNTYIYKKAVEMNAFKNNPWVFLEYFLSKLPFIIFFYLPVFALIIWLFYFYKPINYFEHLVFTFHVQSTFFVFILIGLLIDLIFKIEVFTVLMQLVFLFYLYKALRNFYKENRFVTIVKFLALNIIFLTLAIIAAIISALTFFAIR